MEFEINLLEHGMYQIDYANVIKLENENSPKGYFYETNSEQYLSKQTEKIPLSLDTAFGIKFQLISEDDDSFIPLKIVFDHPEIENPETKFSFTRTEKTFECEVNTLHLEIFIFDYTWEMVEGYWTLHLEYHNQIVFSKEFELYIPHTQNEIEEENFFYDM